jgi:YesN/AraC family two-component response regulator
MPAVLVIEHDSSVRQEVSRVLRNAGFGVETAENGRQGLDLATSRLFDVILTDVRLPDVTSGDLLSQLTGAWMARPVVATGLPSVRSAVEALKQGATDYLEKPVDAELLVQCIRRLALRTPPQTAAGDPRVARALQLIRRRYVEPNLTPSAIAQDLRLSPWHLAHLLKRQTGRGFLQHLHRARIFEAQSLLATSHLSIKEIAASVGYLRTGQLDVYFMRFHGMTPSAYRRQVRGKAENHEA